MIEEAIVTILRGNSQVSALVASRVYLMEATQSGEFPFLVVTTVGAQRELLHDGPMGIANKLIQVSCISNKVSSAKTLAEKVRKALHDFRGSVGDEFIFYASVQNEVDLSDPDYGHQVAIDIDVSFKEA